MSTPLQVDAYYFDTVPLLMLIAHCLARVDAYDIHNDNGDEVYDPMHLDVPLLILINLCFIITTLA